VNPPVRLPVRVRSTTEADGSLATRLTVYCPTHESSVAVTECESCARCGDVVISRHGASFVVCSPAGERLEPSRQAKLLRRILPSAADVTPCREVMTSNVLCVTSEVALGQVITLLLERGISGAPVVDQNGLPIGIVSKTDLLRDQDDLGDLSEVERPPVSARVPIESSGYHLEAETRTVADVMMPVAFVLPEDAPLSHAVALMSAENVHRIPLVGSDGRVVGILTPMDVLRWMGQQLGFEPEREADRGADPRGGRER